MICKLPFPLVSFRTVNTVTHSCDTSAVLTQILLAKGVQNPDFRFQVSAVSLLLYQILCSNSWEERTFQAYYLIFDIFDIRLKPNLSQFNVSFSIR